MATTRPAASRSADLEPGQILPAAGRRVLARMPSRKSAGRSRSVWRVACLTCGRQADVLGVSLRAGHGCPRCRQPAKPEPAREPSWAERLGVRPCDLARQARGYPSVEAWLERVARYNGVTVDEAVRDYRTVAKPPRHIRSLISLP